MRAEDKSEQQHSVVGGVQSQCSSQMHSALQTRSMILAPGVSSVLFIQAFWFHDQQRVLVSGTNIFTCGSAVRAVLSDSYHKLVKASHLYTNIFIIHIHLDSPHR